MFLSFRIQYRCLVDRSGGCWQLCCVDAAVDDQREGGVQERPRRRAEFHSESESVSVHVSTPTRSADWQEGGATWRPHWGLLTHSCALINNNNNNSWTMFILLSSCLKQHCESSPWFMWWMQHGSRWLPTFGTSRSAWTISPPVGCQLPASTRSPVQVLTGPSVE